MGDNVGSVITSGFSSTRRLCSGTAVRVFGGICGEHNWSWAFRDHSDPANETVKTEVMTMRLILEDMKEHSVIWLKVALGRSLCIPIELNTLQGSCVKMHRRDVNAFVSSSL